MRKLPPLLAVLSLLFSVLAPTGAQEPEAAPPQELRELRQAVQQQSRQIELLTEQVGRLVRALDGRATPAAALPAPSSDVPPPAADPAPEAPRAEAVAKGDKTEPAIEGVRHIVAKGETLTVIAKRYNIPIAELKNANKIQDERKLQIGQILAVPTAKPPEPPDKKDNL